MKEVGLLDDLAEGSAPPGGPCTVQLVIEAFPDEADDIWQIVMNSEVSGAHIARVFSEHGHRTGPESVNRHRRGECKCDLRMPERYVDQG